MQEQFTIESVSLVSMMYMKAEKHREEATRDGAMYLKFSMATNLGKVLPWAGDLLQYSEYQAEGKNATIHILNVHWT